MDCNKKLMLPIVAILVPSFCFLVIDGFVYPELQNAYSQESAISQNNSIFNSGLLKEKELVLFESKAEEVGLNESQISKFKESTDESYITIPIPTTNTSIGGPYLPSESVRISGEKNNTAVRSDVQDLELGQTLGSNEANMTEPRSVKNISVQSGIANERMTEQPSSSIEDGFFSGDIEANMTEPSAESPATLQPDLRNLNYEAHRVTSVKDGQVSMVAEPSVASNKKLVLYTGNWFAARSTDGGMSWEGLDPSKDFEPFCCDQRVVFDPTRGLFIWYRQGEQYEASNENVVRLGVSKDTINWTMYEIIPSNLSNSLHDYFLDYPELSITNNHVYITTNAFSPDGSTDGSLIIRISLDDLSNSTDVNYSFYLERGISTFTPVQGATDKMYWATHVTNDRMRIYEWDDSPNVKNIKSFDRTIPPWFVLIKGLGKCSVLKSVSSYQLPEGNWCERADSRITSGWISGNTIGFVWNADAGSTSTLGATFPWPYINAATFDISKNMSYAERPYLWNKYYPFQLATIAPSMNGELGLIAYYGNEINKPGLVFGVENEGQNIKPWDVIYMINSTVPPPVQPSCAFKGYVDERYCKLPNLLSFNYEWGDYITIRPNDGVDSQWYGAAYIVEAGGKATPYYFILGSR